MQNINDYFRQFTYQSFPENGTPPNQVVWCQVGQINIRGKRIYVADSWCIYDGVDMPLPAGRYELTAECFAYGDDGRVARLRGLQEGKTFFARKLMGNYGVDVASAGVMDADAFDAWADANEEAAERWDKDFMESQLNNNDAAGFFPCEGAKTEMAHISTGFGDGYYPVYALLNGNEVVGFETLFLQANQGYFDDAEFEELNASCN